jgi:two-component system, cell cycle response regulator DivK
LTSAPETRILIVEDNALNLELATEVLRAQGHAVLQAHTAEEGLRLARSERPDLILLDVRLPGMDGLAAVRALKEDARMTAQAMTGDEAQARLAGFDAYVTKPIDTRTLPQLVARLLPPRSRL